MDGICIDAKVRLVYAVWPTEENDAMSWSAQPYYGRILKRKGCFRACSLSLKQPQESYVTGKRPRDVHKIVHICII